MTAGAVGRLVARTREATGLDVFQVQRGDNGTVVFATTDGRVGTWWIRSGQWALLDL